MLHNYTLETERLILRAPSLADVGTIKVIINHPDIAKMTLNIPYPYPDTAAIEWISNLESSEAIRYNFLITMKDNGAVIGGIGLHPHERFKRAEIGYWLGLDFWNKGYATEATRRIIDFGFEALGLERIQAGYLPENPASRRVMEKAGMQYEGTLRNYVQKADTNYDLGYCAIIRQDWLKR
jgi:[ribosomal protein S5]-alanine N-acetyltransferase